MSCISNARCALNGKLLLDVAKRIPKSADTMIESIGQALVNTDEVRIMTEDSEVRGLDALVKTQELSGE